MRTCGRSATAVVAALLAGVLPGLPLAAVAAESLDAQALIREVETKYRGETAWAVMRMRIRTAAWSRELVMESWSRGRDDFLVEIREPAKERGIRTLKLGDDIWNYLPRIDKLMKIPSSMMGDAWMGSHVTNDDLVQDSKIEELYEFAVAYADDATAAIIAAPKADAAVVWGRIFYVVDRVRQVPVEVRYDDEDGIPVRRMVFADVRRIGDRWIPMRMTVEPLDKPAEATEIIYESLRFGEPMSADRFSLRALRR